MTKSKMHYFHEEIATQFGVGQAIIINHLLYWISNNLAKSKNYHDGRTWTYNAVNEFSIYFPYWSESQIRTILKSLLKQDVIIENNYNKHKYDRTKWYAFNDEQYWLSKYNPIDRIDKWKPQD